MISGIPCKENSNRIASEALRFDLLKQLADIKPYAPQPEKQKKVGRNDPCPCGSGKKYKRCCGK